MKNDIANDNWQQLKETLAIDPAMPAWLKSIKEEAKSTVSSQDLPTRKDEAWKYLNVKKAWSSLPEQATENALAAIPSDLIPYEEGMKMVFVNGQFNKDLSSLGDLPEGVICLCLSEAIEKHPKLVETYFAKLQNNNSPFSQLNTAMATTGLFLYVPKDVEFPRALQLFFASTPGNVAYTLSQPFNLIICEDNSKLRLFEQMSNHDAAKSFHNQQTHIFLGEYAELGYSQVVLTDKQSQQLLNTQVYQSAHSQLRTYRYHLNAALTREDLEVHFLGEHASAKLHGLMVAQSNAEIDSHLTVNHQVAHCTSDQVYKTIILDKGHAIFNGRVYVAPHADKTQADQSNKNLLLSANSVIDTKPELEIHADDVQCSHGATVGQLEEEAIFYLRSRGIPESEAAHMLTEGFANELISMAPCGLLQQYIKKHFDTIDLLNDKGNAA